ncbi:MAG: exo-alpha-sialidase [Sedimentisphaerales bacterium]|nr:exo-alpha-sialidase [Sedimentisphaerales bacterium]
MIRKHLFHLILIPILLHMLGCCSHAKEDSHGVVLSEFIFEEAPFARCHASTIAETKDGLVAAWFGGTQESQPDVGIWLSHRGPSGWSPVRKVADGSELSGRQVACWNPVLFQPTSGPLMLFYKVGDDEPEWWGEYKTSNDGGKTWSKPTRLPDGFLGPIKNKPVQLPDGSILSPSSIEYYTKNREVWQIHLEWSKDMGKTWEKIGPLNEGKKINAIQPSILMYPDGMMQILCRTERAGRICQAWSRDMGRTWSEMSLTELPNPDAGTDAVMLNDGRALLAYNHSTSKDRDREFLNVAVSQDGKKWYAALVLENQQGEYSYPAVIQTSDGLAHVTYTWKRKRIKHVVLDPTRLELKEIRNGKWPK